MIRCATDFFATASTPNVLTNKQASKLAFGKSGSIGRNTPLTGYVIPSAIAGSETRISPSDTPPATQDRHQFLAVLVSIPPPQNHGRQHNKLLGIEIEQTTHCCPV